MAIRSFILLVILAALSLPLLIGSPGALAASTRTWTGGDPANSNWTDPDNWDTGAPVAGDSLVFPDGAQRKGNTNDFPAGTDFQDITFTGSFYEIDGNAIDLLGNLLQDGTDGETNVLDLPVNGPGAVNVQEGRLALLALNGYTGGTFVTMGATLLVSGDGSLGDTTSGTTVSNGSRLQLANGADLGDEPVLVIGEGPDGLGGLQSLSGTNQSDAMVFNGDVTVGIAQSTLILRNLQQAGSGGLKLVGGGKLQVEGAVAGTGDVLVEHGNLTWNTTFPPPITVEKEGLLRGIGTIASASSTGGTVWPGNGSAPGVLTSVGPVSLAGGALRIDLDGPAAGSGYGQLITGSLSIPSSVAKLELDLTFVPTIGQTFTIVNAAAPTTGAFFGLPEGHVFAVGGYAFSITYKGGADGNDIVLTVLRQVAADLAASITAEPSTAVPGQTITYTLGMHNAGPDAASTPRFTMGMPEDTTFVSVNAPGWTCATPLVGGTGSLTCTGPTLAPDASATITLTVRVNPAATGEISATVATFSNTNDPSSIDNSAHLNLPVSQGPGELPFRRYLPLISRDP